MEGLGGVVEMVMAGWGVVGVVVGWLGGGGGGGGGDPADGCMLSRRHRAAEQRR